QGYPHWAQGATTGLPRLVSRVSLVKRGSPDPAFTRSQALLGTAPPEAPTARRGSPDPALPIDRRSASVVSFAPRPNSLPQRRLNLHKHRRPIAAHLLPKQPHRRIPR